MKKRILQIAVALCLMLVLLPTTAFADNICEDTDKDHKCDYGCGKDFGTHEDADLNHICDYGCKEAIGICADADKDHKCDYGCGKNFGTHVDADLNHICDYGCKEAIGICADADKDHKCDYGCGKTFGVCSGGTATCKDKAVCDYCRKPYGELDGSTHAGGTEVRNAKDATCYEDGYTGDTYCKGCETKLSSGKSVDKTGHDYESKVTKEATTTSTGTKTYTCKNCEHSYEEVIAKLTTPVVKYTVTFDACGGTVYMTSTTTGEDGKLTLTELPIPVRPNYAFAGWFLKDGKPVTNNTVFTENTTVYARWQTVSSPSLPPFIGVIVDTNLKKDEPITTKPTETKTEETKPVEKPTQVEPTQVETTWENPFIDVSETDAFYEAVQFVYKRGYMNGMFANTFAPDGNLTRSMLVTVLYRAAGSPVIKDANPFTDVAEDAWYYNAVVWAKSIGLVTGITETEFAPENLLTREQLVTIFYRYATFLGYDVSVGEETNILSYEDFADIAEYAIPAMQWACGAGLIENIDGNILPQDNATRALVAMVLFGFYA